MFLVALFLLPITYAIKFILDVPDTLWVDPSLVLAFFAFVLHFVEAKKFTKSLAVGLGLVFTVYYFTSSALGVVTAPNWMPAEFYSAQNIFSEPAKLSLIFILFYLTFYYASKPRSRFLVANVFGATATLQFLIGCFMAAVFYLSLPLPLLLKTYIDQYAWRQSAWFGSFPLFRLGGTFIEAPPFGLYMLCAFMVSLYEYRQSKTKLQGLYSGISFLGVILSFSIQGLLGLGAFLGIFLLSRCKLKPKTLTRWFWNGTFLAVVLFLSLPFTFYLVFILSGKFNEVSRFDNAAAVKATSVGERYYHFANSLDILNAGPFNAAFGIGNRGYGFYANRLSNGVFPTTVVPQMLLTDIMVSSGLVGLALFSLWLLVVLAKLSTIPGYYGVAVWCGAVASNFAQANWKWAAFFVVLAFFLGVARERSHKSVAP